MKLKYFFWLDYIINYVYLNLETQNVNLLWWVFMMFAFLGF
jgi:hypothetical protein